MFNYKALLKAWPAARFGVWLHNQYFKKSSAATPYGHDSNEGKSTVVSISAVLLMSHPAVSKAGHYRLEMMAVPEPVRRGAGVVNCQIKAT